MIRAPAVDKHIVYKCSTWGGNGGIEALSNCEAPNIVGGEPLDVRLRFRSGQLHLPHMANIKNSGVHPDGQMLLDGSRILYGHFPAAEFHHLGPHLTMDGVQYGSLQFRQLRQARLAVSDTKCGWNLALTTDN